MVDPIKGCTEINLHDPSLLATLQCTLQCMGHAQKCITCGGSLVTTVPGHSCNWGPPVGVALSRHFSCFTGIEVHSYLLSVLGVQCFGPVIVTHVHFGFFFYFEKKADRLR